MTGRVEIALGRGLARPFGQAIARKLGIPLQPGPHTLRVEIDPPADRLLWSRCFDDCVGDRQRIDFTFRSIGTWPDGLWLEQTGPVRLGLGLAVEVIDGVWYWRCRKAWLHGIRLPLVLFPQSTEYKCVEDGPYRFQVTFTILLLGAVLAYGGVLESQPVHAAE